MKLSTFPFLEQRKKAASLEAQWEKANSGEGHCLWPHDYRFLFSYIHSLEKVCKGAQKTLEHIKGCETEIECIGECHFLASETLRTLFHS